jgi:hypothetical protein
MQTTLRPIRPSFGFTRTQLLVLGLAAGILALSIVGFIARRDSAPTTSQSPSAIIHVANNERFLEANLLPNAAPTVASNAHMLDINQLPEMSPASISNYRFLEANLLPGDDTSAGTPSGLLANRE